MPKNRPKIFLLSFFLILSSLFRAEAQFVGNSVDKVISESLIQSQVEFLCDSLCGGRAMGTTGSSEAAFWIARQFRDIGVMPLGTGYVSSFDEAGNIGHNILAFFPGRISQKERKYVIIASHYDHIGTLNGVLYPGADSNASGVSALLNLARLLQSARPYGISYNTNVIFAALDGKQFSMAGSKSLYSKIERGEFRDPISATVITPSQIELFVNIDILGATTAPLTADRRDYIIMLGDEEPYRSSLRLANQTQGTRMELGYDYYGSKDFTDLFYRRICDQRVFLEHKIPSIMFTSGITMQTNKTEDNPSLLDYDVLLDRTRLIFHWLEYTLK